MNKNLEIFLEQIQTTPKIKITEAKYLTPNQKQQLAEIQKKLDAHEEQTSTFQLAISESNQPSKLMKLISIEENDKIIGAATIKIDEHNRGIIGDVFIEQNNRNQNLGTRLMEFAIRELRKHTDDISLRVSGGNERALNFYNRLNFQVSEYILKWKN